MKGLFAVAGLVLVGVGCDDDSGLSNNGTPPATAGALMRTDIVSDQGGAGRTDATLVNAWGLAFNPAGFAWVSAAGSGLSEVYDVSGNHVIPSVTIPGPGGAMSSPTGQVFNGDANAFGGDTFIFVTEDGTVAGWQPSDGAQAMMRADNSASGAIYKGVALAQSRLFAANFHAGTVDVYDSSYHAVSVQGAFRDAQLPSGYAPFNVAAINGALVVTYALQDEMGEDDVKGPGNGFVDLYDTNGNLMTRLLSGGQLNSPWGVTLAPSSFAAAPGRLLIGNFGDGVIHSYDFDANARTATPAGALTDQSGVPMAIDGLWAIEFGNGAGGFAANQLYFTAGPADESHGVFGRLQATGSVGGTNGGTSGGTGGTSGGTTGGVNGGGTTGGGTTGGGSTSGGTTGPYMP
jgi:uncharacterized protein (TIGR03118 family)